MAKKTPPKKPKKDFPLFPHQAGYWCKKIKGRHWYFGNWDDPEGALELYLRCGDWIKLHGEWPPDDVFQESISLAELCNRFLAFKESEVEGNRLSPRTFADYHATCKRLCDILGRDRAVAGLVSADFAAVKSHLDKTRNNRSLGNEIGRIRVVFNYGLKEELIDRPPKYGAAFKRPEKAIIRRERQSKPKQYFTPKQIQKLLDKAGQPLKAMILLGLNSGMGPADIARIEYRNIDFNSGWIDYPRHKTACERRFAMWPITKRTLKEAIKQRPEGGNPNEVFCTVKGKSWFKKTSDSPISKEFRKLCIDCKLHTKRGRVLRDASRFRDAGSPSDHKPADNRFHHGPCGRKHRG